MKIECTVEELKELLNKNINTVTMNENGITIAKSAYTEGIAIKKD